MAEARRITVAALSGNLDWSCRHTCSSERFDAAVARRYVEAYTQAALERVDRAAAAGARLIVAPEYFRGSELFLSTPENRVALAEPPDGPTARRLADIARRHQAFICCAYDVDHGPNGVVETAVLAGPDGRRWVQVKHPRRVPAPPDWPFNTGPRVYDAGPVCVGVTVCSDCTYDPGLPLMLARHGMELLLLPGCGFAGANWEHVVVVRARDTQSIVVYADDGRAAIVNARGDIVAKSATREDMVLAEVEIQPKKSSPDAE